MGNISDTIGRENQNKFCVYIYIYILYIYIYITRTYSGYVFVVLFIQHAKRMRRIVLSPVVCQVVQYFSTLFHNRRDF